MNKKIRSHIKAELRVLDDTSRLTDQISEWSRSKTKLINNTQCLKNSGRDL